MQQQTALQKKDRLAPTDWSGQKWARRATDGRWVHIVHNCTRAHVHQYIVTQMNTYICACAMINIEADGSVIQYHQ